MGAWQRLEKIRQAIDVERPIWRELKDDWPSFGVQQVYTTEEPVKSHLWVLQFLHVRDKAAALDGESEISRAPWRARFPPHSPWATGRRCY